MSQENVEIVLGLFENTTARNFTAVMDAYADDVVLTLHGERRVLGKGAVGKKAVGEWFGDWFTSFDSDYHFEIEETRDWGDRVLVVATHHARGRASGVPVKYQAAWIYTLRDGKVVRCESYRDRASALEAAGGNVEAVQAIYENWSAGDLEGALAHIDPDIVWTTIEDAPDAGAYRGHGGAHALMNDWLEHFEDMRMEFDEVIEADGCLVAVQRVRTRGRGSSIETEATYAVAYHFRGAKVVQIQEFRTKRLALEAAGLAAE